MVGQWLSFTSSQCPLRIWLTVLGEAGEASEGYCFLGVSRHDVFAALVDDATGFDSPAPAEAVGVRVATFAALDHLVRRAFRLSQTLPDELLH